MIKSKNRNKQRSRFVRSTSTRWFVGGLCVGLVCVITLTGYWYYYQKPEDFKSGYLAAEIDMKEQIGYVNVLVAKESVVASESLRDKVELQERPVDHVPEGALTEVPLEKLARVYIGKNTIITNSLVMVKGEAIYDDTRGDWLKSVEMNDIEKGDYIDLRFKQGVEDHVVLSKKRVINVTGNELQVLMTKKDRIYYNDASQEIVNNGGRLVASLYPDPFVQDAAEIDYPLHFDKSYYALDLVPPTDEEGYRLVVDDVEIIEGEEDSSEVKTAVETLIDTLNDDGSVDGGERDE